MFKPYVLLEGVCDDDVLATEDVNVTLSPTTTPIPDIDELLFAFGKLAVEVASDEEALGGVTLIDGIILILGKRFSTASADR